MFFFMIAILVILASVAVYLITKRGVFSAIGLIVAAALIVLSCVTTVPTGHTGVVTTFGTSRTIPSTPASTWSSPGSRS